MQGPDRQTSSVSWRRRELGQNPVRQLPFSVWLVRSRALGSPGALRPWRTLPKVAGTPSSLALSFADSAAEKRLEQERLVNSKSHLQACIKQSERRGLGMQPPSAVGCCKWHLSPSTASQFHILRSSDWNLTLPASIAQSADIYGVLRGVN